MENIQTSTLNITGMTCTGCERSLTRAISAVPGVQNVMVSKDKGNAIVVFDANLTGAEQFKLAIEEAGFDVL